MYAKLVFTVCLIQCFLTWGEGGGREHPNEARVSLYFYSFNEYMVFKIFESNFIHRCKKRFARFEFATYSSILISLMHRFYTKILHFSFLFQKRIKIVLSCFSKISLQGFAFKTKPRMKKFDVTLKKLLNKKKCSEAFE